MNFVKLFLASSITEFHATRLHIGNFVREMNDDLIQHEAYAEMAMCEDLSNAVAFNRKQDEYNQSIQESDLFYLLVGSKVGQYTMEEVHIALNQYRIAGKPALFPFIVKKGKNESTDESVQQLITLLERENIPVFCTSSVKDIEDSIRAQVLTRIGKK